MESAPAFDEFRAKFPPDTKIINVIGTSDEFEAHLRCHCKNKLEFLAWLKQYEQLSKITFRVSVTRPRVGKTVLYKAVYRCEHNTYPNSHKRVKTPHKKHTDCSALLRVTIKSPTENRRVRSGDPLRASYPTLLTVIHKHNHRIMVVEALNHPPSPGLEIVKQEPFEEQGNDCYKISPHASLCPDTQPVHQLYDSIYKKEFGEESSSIADNVEELAGQPVIKHETLTKIDHRNTGPSLSSPAFQHKTNSKQSLKNNQANHSDLETDNVEGYNEAEDECTIYSKYEKMCRLCMVQSSNVTTSVFNKLDEKHTIAQAIGVCLYPLQVLPSDNISKSICTKCFTFLKEFIKFRQRCIVMDAKQRELLSLQQSCFNAESYDSSEHSDEYLHEERLSDYEGDKENQDFKSDNTNGQIVKQSVDSNNIRNKKSKTCNATTASVKKKYDKGKEELLRVLEGDEEVIIAKVDESEQPTETSRSAIRSPVSESNDDFCDDSANDVSEDVPLDSSGVEDAEYTENIIIEMVSDEDPPSTSPSMPLVDTSKLPITIKRVETASTRNKGFKRKLSPTSCKAKKDVSMVKSENDEEIVILPSGISVARKELYYSSLGQFSSEEVNYVFDSKYVLAGGYLYEVGLIKENIRRLHCIVPKCPGTAYQFSVRHNEYSDNVDVITSHNHKIPDNLERKSQMFYHILYGKMRRDKNFNFKMLYGQFCKLDPGLLDILPLRKVVQEICKQGPSPAPPVLHTFGQFYNSVENDQFHRIHFTDNRVQFYQDRFEADDGAKAVVFANREVIDQYSSSKLMYVDASFVIKSSDFPYQLITVLVWVEESYYPIFYAFVNIKSSEIYKKIFSFLYNHLAPSLRPHEIITEYEADLYYALGETYVTSSIGGSMFYFTQNVYKKICSLNLARELELNSNFRNIYNMVLMLPLLPVNTIMDGLNNIEVQADELDLQNLTHELFTHVRNEWISKVTPELFCVHRLENRINENIVAPFKKLRDLIIFSRNKGAKNQSTTSVIITIEKLIDLEKFLRETYSSATSKKSFTKDLSSSQKKIILKAWNYIENHPMININQFFLKVLGYIKCMENQLWIWGFYRYTGSVEDVLIDASNFSIINDGRDELEQQEPLEDEPMEEDTDAQNVSLHLSEGDQNEIIEEYYIEEGGSIRKVATKQPKKYSEAANYIEEFTDEVAADEQEPVEEFVEKETIVMEAVIDENGKCVLQEPKGNSLNSQNRATLNYVYK